MTVVSHEPVHTGAKPTWTAILVPELWAFLAIVVIWLSVLFTAIYGPDIQTNSVAGDHSTVPSVVVVALFAFLSTWAIAAFAFRRKT